MDKSTPQLKTDHKNARRGVIETSTVGGRNKADKPVVVQYRWRPGERIGQLVFNDTSQWRKFGAYRTVAIAKATMERQASKYPYYELRLKPEKEQQMSTEMTPKEAIEHRLSETPEAKYKLKEPTDPMDGSWFDIEHHDTKLTIAYGFSELKGIYLVWLGYDSADRSADEIFGDLPALLTRLDKFLNEQPQGEEHAS